MLRQTAIEYSSRQINAPATNQEISIQNKKADQARKQFQTATPPNNHACSINFVTMRGGATAGNPHLSSETATSAFPD